MTVEKTSWNSGCPDFERLWSMRTPVLTEAEREVTTTAENTPHLIKQAMFAGYEEGRRAAAPGPAADSEGTRLARQIGELLLTAPGAIPELPDGAELGPWNVGDNWQARLAVWHVRTLVPTLQRLRSQQGSKTQRVWCLKHIRRAGKRGLTNHELADLATANSSNGPVEVHRITPRTSELKRDGHIRQSIRQPFRANAAGSRCTVLVAVEHLT